MGPLLRHPEIDSASFELDDDDQYKRTMRQWILREAPDIDVRWGFVCRTPGIRLADTVPVEQLREHFDHMRTLRYSEAQLDYARRQTGPDGRPLFNEDFLAAEAAYRLPEIEVDHGDDGSLLIRPHGRWSQNTYWEIHVLSAVSEIHNLNLQDGHSVAELENEGMRRLDAKIDQFERLIDLFLVEFGTRRRFSRRHQRRVLERLLERLGPQRVSTSNIALAREFGLDAKGTIAHELFMVMAALRGMVSDESLLGSQRFVLERWYALYGEALAIALSDTFGSGAFLRDFFGEMARLWRGARHDSACPFNFGEALIAFYRDPRNGIDPLSKTLFFSDGLTADKIERLHARFYGRIRLAYGMGTDLTNDVGRRFSALSNVMKVTAVLAPDGRWVSTVKLSDNANKAIGEESEVARYRRVWRHGDLTAETLVY